MPTLKLLIGEGLRMLAREGDYVDNGAKSVSAVKASSADHEEAIEGVVIAVQRLGPHSTSP